MFHGSANKFLNHSHKIYGEERQTSKIFLEVGMVLLYAWNASPIDETDIIRSVPAIGCKLKYPMDIDIAEISQVIDMASQSVVGYLRHIQHDVEFSRQLVAWFIEDRRTFQRERSNWKKYLVDYESDDVVIARIVVHSK